MERLKFKDGMYWITIEYSVIEFKRRYYWQVRCCNGRVKCQSKTDYKKRCLAYNDAIAFASYTGLKVR